jgi:hypothetical protein
LSPSGDHHWGNRPANHILIEWRKR